MKKIRYLVCAIGASAAAFAALAEPALAADKLLGKFGRWEAHRSSANNETFCYAATLPAKSDGKVAKRGEAALMISHWPKRKSFGQVQAKAGYALKKDAGVELTVGKKTFKLVASGDSAYGENEKADAAILAALKGSKNATAASRPAEGNAKIVDTYTIDGLAKALAAIDKECGPGKK